MIGFIKGLFGGGSWGIYLVALTVIGAFWLERGYMKSKIEKQETQIETLTKQKDSALQNMASQARTDARRATSLQDLTNIEDEINALPQTRYCANSKPVLTVIGGMYDNQRELLAGGTDKPTIRVPENTDGAESRDNDGQ